MLEAAFFGVSKMLSPQKRHRAANPEPSSSGMNSEGSACRHEQVEVDRPDKEQHQKAVEERWAEEFNAGSYKWILKIPKFLGGQDCVDAWFHGFGKLSVKVIEARGILAADQEYGVVGDLKTSDAYAKVVVDGQKQQTDIHPTTLQPRWNEEFHFRVRDPGAKVLVELWDCDVFNDDDFLGQVEIPVANLAPSVTYSGWLRLQDNEKKRRWW